MWIDDYREDGYGWDDSSPLAVKRPILKPGIYEFQVVDTAKIWYEGSSKLPPCPAARLWLMVNGTRLIDTLYLTESLIWKITQFFKSVGEPEDSRYGKLLSSIGMRGDCHVEQRETNNGTIINSIDRYLSSDDDVELIMWRDSVLERDGYKCRMCGSKKYIQAHHIIPVMADRSKKYILDNGITLCRECHERAHPWTEFGEA